MEEAEYVVVGLRINESIIKYNWASKRGKGC